MPPEISHFFQLFARHSNGLEITQMVVAAVGVIFSFWATLDAVKDSMALAMSGKNGARRILAAGNVYTEIERLLVHSILFLIGLVSTFVPPPYHESLGMPGQELLQHSMTRLGLVLVTLVKVNGALRSRRERTRFVRRMTMEGWAWNTPATAIAPPPGCPVLDYREMRKDAHEGLGEKRAEETKE